MKNFVYIFCDELRQDALNCYGNPAGPLKTPHMDSLAARGVLYENCFCNSPVCLPSRASLMTGLYPEDTGAYDNEAQGPNFHLPRPLLTFPEVLAAAGYDTASFGKTHLPRELKPFQLDEQAGSEMHLGLTRPEIQALDRVKPKGPFSFNAASLYPEGRDYYPETVTRNAISWLEHHDAGAPFFLRVSYTQPHSPIILKRGYETLYADTPFSRELPDISQLSEFEQSLAAAVRLDTLTPEELHKIKVYYYGLVAWIDDQVGEILDCLKATGLDKDTVIIVNADHGALRGECRGLGKHVFQRASHAVPLIIADPAMPDALKGSRERRLCSNIDLARTILGMAGVEAPAQFKGGDLLAGEFPEAVFSTIGYGQHDSCAFPNRQLGRLPGDRGWPRRACIRKGTCRLDLSSRIDDAYTDASNEDLFFVDTAVCPAEDRNMAGLPAYADTVAALRRELREHLAGCVEVDPETIHVTMSAHANQQ